MSNSDIIDEFKRLKSEGMSDHEAFKKMVGDAGLGDWEQICDVLSAYLLLTKRSWTTQND